MDVPSVAQVPPRIFKVGPESEVDPLTQKRIPTMRVTASVEVPCCPTCLGILVRLGINPETLPLETFCGGRHAS